jgi:hypothetical protein
MEITKREIGHYDIKIKSAEHGDEGESKTYYLYTNKNPSSQAKTFCEKNGIHQDGKPCARTSIFDIYLLLPQLK